MARHLISARYGLASVTLESPCSSALVLFSSPSPLLLSEIVSFRACFFVTLACRADATGSTRRLTRCYARLPTATGDGSLTYRTRTKQSFAFCAACARYPTRAEGRCTNHGTFHTGSAHASVGTRAAAWCQAKASPGGRAALPRRAVAVLSALARLGLSQGHSRDGG